MTRRICLLAALFAVAGSGCIVGRESTREDQPVAAIPAPPPPPSDEADAAPPPVRPGEQADPEVFREELSQYGHWEYTPEYGQVWVPSVAVGWRPYWYGHWVLTDWGWTFASDDPWGWAAYHYGRWGFSPLWGWYWVPGYVWGPAWVSWRVGAGWYCWAPLGPRGVVYGYNSPAWVAVHGEHFTQPIYAHAVVGTQRTAPIVRGARALPIARPAPGAHFGPSVASVSSATGRPIRPVSAGTVVGRAAPRAGAVAPSHGGASAPRASPGRGGGPGRRDTYTPVVPVAPPPASAPAPGAGSAPAPGGGSAPRAAPPPPSVPRAAPVAPRGGGASRIAPPSGGTMARTFGGGGGAAPRASAPSRALGVHGGGGHRAGGHR
jgi:hypothetical protein